MKRIIRLTESDLARIVRRVITETKKEPYTGTFPSIDVLNNFKGVKYEVVSMDPSVPTKMFKINGVDNGDEEYLVNLDVTEIGLDKKDIGGESFTVEFNCIDKSMGVKSSYLNQNPKKINVKSTWVSNRIWDLYCKPAKN
jgi:hypothetical protein